MFVLVVLLVLVFVDGAARKLASNTKKGKKHDLASAQREPRNKETKRAHT